MIKEVIKYEDYDGNQREEVAYFNLDKRELFNLNLKFDGGFEAYFRAISETSNAHELARLFEEVIQLAYGRKSPDGRKLEKTKEILADFMATPAYSELYMSMIQDSDKAADFMNGVVAAAKRQIEAEANAKVVDMPTV